MKSKQYHPIYSQLLSRIPVTFLLKVTKADLIIPYYHMICDDERLHIKYLYPHKNVIQFKEDIEFLLKTFVPISLSDLLGNLKNGAPLPRRSFLMTFDDGFREMHDIVAPILKQKGVPAVFFINSDFTDNRQLCYQHKASIMADRLAVPGAAALREKVKSLLTSNSLHYDDAVSGVLSIPYGRKNLIDNIAGIMGMDFDGYLHQYKPYLASDQIRSLLRQGFCIGAHSIDHPLYADLSHEERLHQTKESMQYVKEAYGLAYGAFAFPHKDTGLSLRFLQEIHENGLVDVSFGTAGMVDDAASYNLQRFSLEKPLLPAERIIAMHMVKKIYRIATGKGKIKRAD